MHVVSLGVGQHIAGNVLSEMLWCILNGPHEQRLAEVWECSEENYELRPKATASGRLTKSMFVEKDAPS